MTTLDCYKTLVAPLLLVVMFVGPELGPWHNYVLTLVATAIAVLAWPVAFVWSRHARRRLYGPMPKQGPYR